MSKKNRTLPPITSTSRPTETAVSFAERGRRLTGLEINQIPDATESDVSGGVFQLHSPHGSIWYIDLDTEADDGSKLYSRAVLLNRSKELPPADPGARGVLPDAPDPVCLDPVTNRAVERGRWISLCVCPSSLTLREIEKRNEAEHIWLGGTRTMGDSKEYFAWFLTFAQAKASPYGSLIQSREGNDGILQWEFAAPFSEAPPEDTRDSLRAARAWIQVHVVPRVDEALRRGADRGVLCAMLRHPRHPWVLAQAWEEYLTGLFNGGPTSKR